MPVTRSQFRNLKQSEGNQSTVELFSPLRPRSNRSKTRTQQKKPVAAIPIVPAPVEVKVPVLSFKKLLIQEPSTSASAAVSTSGHPTSAPAAVSSSCHHTSAPAAVSSSCHPTSALAAVSTSGHPTSAPATVSSSCHPTSAPAAVSTSGHPSFAPAAVSSSCHPTAAPAAASSSCHSKPRPNLRLLGNFVNKFGPDSQLMLKTEIIRNKFASSNEATFADLSKLFEKTLQFHNHFKSDPQKALKHTPHFKEAKKLFRDAKPGLKHKAVKRKDVAVSEVEPSNELQTVVPSSFNFLSKPISKQPSKKAKVDVNTPVHSKTMGHDDTTTSVYYTMLGSDFESDLEEHNQEKYGTASNAQGGEENYVIMDESDEDEDKVAPIFKLPPPPKSALKKKGSALNETCVASGSGTSKPTDSTFALDANAKIQQRASEATFVVVSDDDYVIADETVDEWAEAEDDEEDKENEEDDDIFNTASVFQDPNEHVNYDITLLNNYDEEGLTHRTDKKIPEWTKDEYLTPSLYIFCPAHVDEEINAKIFPQSSTSMPLFPGACASNSIIYHS